MSFAIIYFVIVGLRLLVEPFDRYWLSLQNRFDLFVTLILFVTAMLWVSPFYLPREVLRFFNLLRLLQLLKLLSHVDFLSFMADCFVRISLGSLPILTLVYCATSVWAIIGCQLWGGYVYGGNPALQGSDMFEASMDVLNFNDFPSALMVFCGMIVTGGPFTEIIDAYATSSGGFLSGLFFMSYMYVIFFVFFNCFVSFVIDAFISRYELRKTDTLDTKQTETLRSLYATYHDAEYEVVASMRWEGSEELYKRMFADELEELHQVSPSPTPHPHPRPPNPHLNPLTLLPNSRLRPSTKEMRSRTRGRAPPIRSPTSTRRCGTPCSHGHCSRMSG